MQRTQLTDGTGRWFNAETAQEWAEYTEEGGWTLYRTHGSGRWVLRTWSCYEDSSDTYEEISAEEATKRWLSLETANTEPRELVIPKGLEEHVLKLEV